MSILTIDLDRVIAERNTNCICPVCNGNIADRKIVIYEGLVAAMRKVYLQCKQRNNYLFSMKDIKHLLSKNDYARFNDLIRFSRGIIFKPVGGAKGYYGVNFQRAEDYFAGRREIIESLTINQIDKSTVEETTAYFGKTPKLGSLLTQTGEYKRENFEVKPAVDLFGNSIVVDSRKAYATKESDEVLYA